MTTEEMLLQLVEGQKQLFEGQKQLFEGQKQLFEGQKQLFEEQKKTNKRLDNIESDIAEIKEEAHITRHILNRHGEILEQMVKDLEPLNLLNVKYE